MVKICEMVKDYRDEKKELLQWGMTEKDARNLAKKHYGEALRTEFGTDKGSEIITAIREKEMISVSDSCKKIVSSMAKKLGLPENSSELDVDIEFLKIS